MTPARPDLDAIEERIHHPSGIHIVVGTTQHEVLGLVSWARHLEDTLERANKSLDKAIEAIGDSGYGFLDDYRDA